MMNDECSRRNFLKKFASLSGGALMLSATAMACYGPPSSGDYRVYPEVLSQTFLDAQSNPIALYDNQSVPINTQFLIEFNKDMKVSVPATAEFTDASNNAVTFNISWYAVRLVALTPAAALIHDTVYYLRILDAEDTFGLRLSATSRASANFKTAS
jgi:hypothetical protein